MTNWRDLYGIIASSTVFGDLLRSRADVIAKAGTTFGGERQHYKIFGWPIAPDYSFYYHLYKRGGIAKRVVNAYPQATWRIAPAVRQSNNGSGEKTEFEKTWAMLVEKRSIFHYLERVDRLARIGTFAVLFLGYSDVGTWDELVNPVGALSGNDPLKKLLYIQPYGEDKIEINEWDDDPKSERFGRPKIYQLRLSTPSLSGKMVKSVSRSVMVHHSRLIHVAEDVLESDLEGYPCLESVINYILDIEKTHGSAAEAFYQQSPPLTVFNADKDANLDASTFSDSDMEDQIDGFINGYKRWLATQGITTTSLNPQIGDPTAVKEMLLELIAGTTGIPKRILVGSERGELASTQDETAWNSRVEERQLNWAEPMVLRPLLDELISKGVIPQPPEGYQIEWSSNQALSDEVSARISQTQADALSKYAASPNTEELVPPDIFLESILKLDPEVIERIRELRQEVWDKESEDMLKDEDELAQQYEQEMPQSPFVQRKSSSTGSKGTAKKSGLGKGKAFEESEHPRARGGKFTDKAGTKKDPSRVKRALSTHVPATRDLQRAAIKNEKDLAKRIGAKHLPDNEPFDVKIGKDHVIEVKTVLVGKNNKITMHKDSRERKVAFAEKTGAKPHTVVFDNRNNKVYYSEGVGSFRLGSMEHMGTIGNYGTKLKERIKGKSD